MQKYLLIAMAALLGIAGWLGYRAEQDRKAAVERVARLENELAKRGVVVPPVESVAEEKAPIVEQKPMVPAKPGVDVSKYLSMIDQLRARTVELEKELLEARGDEERAREKTTGHDAEVKRLKDQIASIQEDAQRQQRVSEALETELKFKAQRLIQIETNEKLLQEKLAKAELASKRVVVVSKELEDLQRRREAALVGLERRYREVTDLYRSFSLNLQTRESPGQGLQAGDLSRIQTALQQAEEELRQLRGLNARVAELARAK